MTMTPLNVSNLWRRAMEVALAAVVASVIASWGPAQTSNYPIGAAQNSVAAQSSAGAETVYDAGDVYLPGSRVYVFVGKTGFGHEHGVVGQIRQGHINLAPGRDAGNLLFDMTSFAADTPDARKYVGLQSPTDESTQRQVNANMLGAAVLDTARYPTAGFAIAEIAELPQPSQRGLVQYLLKGNLSLHGVERPIQVVAEAEDKNGWTHLRGSFSLVQSQFGITPFSKAFGAVGVSDQLTVWGDFWISKQRQVAALPSATQQGAAR